MTIDANLIEGAKIWFLLGCVVGIVFMCALAWGVSSFGAIDDDDEVRKH